MTAETAPVERSRRPGAPTGGWRDYSCGRCGARVTICRSCDRGNRYCSPACSRAARIESLKGAAHRFALSPAGRAGNRRRQREYRARVREGAARTAVSPRAPAGPETPPEMPARAAIGDSVTHHGSAGARSTAKHRGLRRPAGIGEVRCAFCGRLVGFHGEGPRRRRPRRGREP